MSLRTCLTALLLISMSFAAHAVIYYKSVDENGNVQYTQTRPNNTKTERIKLNVYAPDNSSTYKRPSLKSDKQKTDKKADKPEESKPARKKTNQKTATKKVVPQREPISLR